jgi:hypothetical protein
MIQISRKTEEEKINKVLEGCTIARVKYDAFTFEMPMYIPFEPPFHMNGYEYVNPYKPYRNPVITLPKKKSKEKKSDANQLAPLTIYRIYYYRNVRTGNTVELSDSSKKIITYKNVTDKRTGRKKKIMEAPYYSLRATFRSDHENVRVDDIYFFLFHVMKRYYWYIQGIKRKQEENRNHWGSRYDHPSEYLRCFPFRFYYAEPCVDIKGSKESIDFLHKHFESSLYVTQFSKRESFQGTKSMNRKRRDGRILNDLNETDYISDRVRAYRYIKGGEHFLRCEIMFDKYSLTQKDIYKEDELESYCIPSKFWEKRCFFCMIDMYRIRYRLRKHPEVLDKVNEILSNNQQKTDGTEYEQIDKVLFLRNLKIDGKKVFRSGKEFLTPKWITLHNLISKALSQLSVIHAPKEGFAATPVMVEEIKLKQTVEERIAEAINLLKKNNLKITYPNIMATSGVSRGSVAKNMHLIKNANSL